MSKTFVAGDVGGTNCRLQLFKLDPSLVQYGGGEVLESEEVYRSKEQGSMEAALRKFLNKYCNTSNWPSSCCLAVAGPIIRKNVANVTNLKWIIDGGELSVNLNIPHVAVINDFVGIGYGLLRLAPHDVYQLNPGVSAVEGSPKACVGAGTGLGECFLTHNGDSYDVWPSEGGHSDFAARNETEFRIMQFIKNKQQLHRVSVERAVSGLGMFHIYDYLRTESPHLVNKEVEKLFETQDPNFVISQASITRRCQLCVLTLDIFMSLYGAEAGNLAIKTLPFGGLYIAGGIAVKEMDAMLRNNNFINGFLEKGRMKEMLQKVPVYVVIHPNVGLLGSQVVCRRLLAQDKPARSKL